MSMSIDDIWNTPLEATPPRTRKDVLASEAIGNTPARPSPAKRRRTTLFLSSDSENDAPSTSKATYRTRTPPPAEKDKQKALIDALFEDLDGGDNDNDDGNDGGFRELAPALNIDALRKEASQRVHRTRLPALTPHQILPSSSPERDLGPDGEDGEGGKKKGGKGKKDDADGTKQRKQIARLDEARLIGETGFSALIKQTKDFKPKGKGHELSDLSKVMGIYQFWTHKMYPKGTFHDNVQRIEKLCHSKRMHNHLGMWRDTAKGLVNGRKPEEPVGDPLDDSDSDGDQEQPEIPVAAASTRSSSPPTRPPSSASSNAPGDDDFDIDAMIREDEERQAASASHSIPQPQMNAPADEDQDMWDQLDGGFDDEVTMQVASSLPSGGGDIEDEDMWDLLREIEGSVPATSKAAPAPVAAPASSTPAMPPPSGAAPAQLRQPATNEEGWDDMYL